VHNKNNLILGTTEKGSNGAKIVLGSGCDSYQIHASGRGAGILERSQTHSQLRDKASNAQSFFFYLFSLLSNRLSQSYYICQDNKQKWLIPPCSSLGYWVSNFQSIHLEAPYLAG